jgi:hypothetical protein
MSHMKKVTGFAAFMVMCVAWTLVEKCYGQAAGLRFWGAGLALVALVLAFSTEIPIWLGNQHRTLTGWRKAYVVAPALCIGLLVIAFPDEIACSVHLRNYRCA